MRPWRSTMSPVTPACSGASKSVTLCPAGSDRVQLADRLLGAEERAGYPTVIRWRVSEASDQASSSANTYGRVGGDWWRVNDLSGGRAMSGSLP